MDELDRFASLFTQQNVMPPEFMEFNETQRVIA